MMLTRALDIYTKLLPLWVAIFAVLGYAIPGPFCQLKPGLSWFFALTMFGIGAVLNVDDFREIARRPLIVLIGCVTQYTVMPLGAWLIARLFDLPPELAVGLILAGSAPGAMASNVISYIAKADVAYSVSLTTVSTLLCPVLTPGLTWWLASSYLPVDFWHILRDVILTVVGPLLLGLALKLAFRPFMERIIAIFPAISVTFIVFICALVVALNRDALAMMSGIILVVTLMLNTAGLSLGYLVGRVTKMGWRQRRTLAIEIGMQNAGLGTVLALKHFGAQAAVPAAFFVILCIMTASVLVQFWRRVDNQTKPEA